MFDVNLFQVELFTSVSSHKCDMTQYQHPTDLWGKPYESRYRFTVTIVNWLIDIKSTCVFKRLVSDAQIKKKLKGKIKYEVKSQWCSNFPKGYAKYCYGYLFLGYQILSISLNSEFMLQKFHLIMSVYLHGWWCMQSIRFSIDVPDFLLLGVHTILPPFVR